MKALVTRPRDDAAGLVEELQRRGIEAIVEPLLRIRFREESALDLDGVQALLVTSANGVRAAAAATADRTLPVFAVGDATGREAQSLGWTRIESAGGNVEDLARLVAARLKPDAGALLHVAGSVVAGDLVRLLGGFSVRRTVLYDADPVEQFSAVAEKLLQEGGLDLAFFYSPRTAARFAELARLLSPRLEDVTALCLSPAVAAAVQGLGWQDVKIAEVPAQASLLAALDEVLAGRHDAERSSKGDAMSEPVAPPPGEVPAAPAAPEPPRVAPPFPETRQEAGLGGGAIWPTIALILVLAVVAAAPFIAPALPWGPKQPAGVLPGEVTTLAERVAALETRPAPMQGVPPAITERLASLEQRLSSTVPPDLAERLKQLEARPAQAPLPAELAQRLQRLEERPQANPEAASNAQAEAQRLAEEVNALQQRLAALEQQEREEAAADRTEQTLLLAVTELRRSSATARPFATELGAAAAMAKDRPELAAALDKLQPLAAEGVPTVALLARQFADTAGAIVRAGAMPSSETWSDAILAKLRALVTIRRVGDAGIEAGPDAVVASAEQALAVGDLAAAVAAVETLDGPAAAAAKPWLDAARRRLALDTALDRAERTLMARLATGGKS